MDNFIENKNGQLAYTSKAAVAAGVETVLASFLAIENAQIFGLKFGALLSDPTAWAAGVTFKVKINGAAVFTITDELGDLLRPAFLPLSIAGKDKIELTFQHNAAAPIDIASTVLVEAF